MTSALVAYSRQNTTCFNSNKQLPGKSGKAQVTKLLRAVCQDNQHSFKNSALPVLPFTSLPLVDESCYHTVLVFFSPLPHFNPFI